MFTAIVELFLISVVIYTDVFHAQYSENFVSGQNNLRKDNRFYIAFVR